MTGLLTVLMAFWLAGQGPALQPHASDYSLELIVTTDVPAGARCRSSMIGFSNIPVECVVGETGQARDCQILSEDRRVQRHRRDFICMAETMRITYPDGRPAVGRTIRTHLNGPNIFKAD